MWLAVGREARADELLQAQALEVLGEVLCEIAPLGIVAGQEDGLVPEDIFVVVEIGVHLLLDVGVLGVELVELCLSGCAKIFIGHRDTTISSVH